MGMSTRSCTHIGVSFIDAWEKDDNTMDKISEVAEELGLDSELQMQEPDKISDMFIGVSFSGKRPNDLEVARAKKKVEKLLPKIEELMGCKASSKVVEWNVVTVTY
jgi:hypothetical protein